MGHFADAAEVINRLAVQYKGMVDAADALAQMGSIESAIASGQTQLQSVLHDLAEATRRVEEIHEEIAESAETSNGLRAQSVADAKQLILDAQMQAASLREAVRRDLDAELAAGRATNAEDLSESLQQIRDARTELTTLTHAIDAMRYDHVRLQEQVAETERALAAIQDQARKLVG